VLSLLFLATTVNFADRATLSIAGALLAKDLVSIPSPWVTPSRRSAGRTCSAAPGGFLLDRFGPKRIYVASVLAWSLVTLLQKFVGLLAAGAAVVVLFVLRLLLSVAESPSFPGNSRIVSAWFPTAEQKTASAIFNSAQYFTLVLFSPIMGFFTHALGWKYVFFVMGLGSVWWRSSFVGSTRPG
jgi:ACS family glucarate transporter-like MFS transporter